MVGVLIEQFMMKIKHLLIIMDTFTWPWNTPSINVVVWKGESLHCVPTARYF